MDRRVFLAAACAAGTQFKMTGVGAASVPSGPVAFTVGIRVKPGFEAEFLELVTPVLDAMRHDPTFLNAALHRDPEDATRFLIYETWADLDDVVHVQLQRAYRKPFADRLPAVLAEARQIGVWSLLRSDGRLSAGPA